MVDFADTQEQAAFRSEVRQFVEEHHPKELAEDAIYSVGLGGELIGLENQ